MSAATHYTILVVPSVAKPTCNALAESLAKYGNAGDCFPVPLNGGTHWLGCSAVGPVTAAMLPALRASIPGSDGYEVAVGEYNPDTVYAWLAERGYSR